MAYQFKRLPQPNAPEERAGPKPFGRRTYVPAPSRKTRSASRVSKVFCALMIILGVAMLAADAL